MELHDHQKKILAFVLEQNHKAFIPNKPRTVPELEYPDELAYYQAPKVDTASWEKLREQIDRGKHEMISISASTPTGRSILSKNVLFAERYSDRSKVVGMIHDSVHYTPGLYDQAFSRARRESKTPRFLPMDFARIEKRVQAQLPAGKFLYPYMRDGYISTGKDKSTLAITQMLIECLKIAEKQNGPLLNPIANVLQGMYGNNKPKSIHTEV